MADSDQEKAAENKTDVEKGNVASPQEQHEETKKAPPDSSSRPSFDWNQFRRTRQELEEPYPNYFCDPVTKELMTDPVVGPSGNSEERKEGRHNYYPNRALKQRIQTEVDCRQALLPLYKNVKGGMQSKLKVLMEQSALPSKEYRPLPDYYYCPITFELIQEPVIDPDGHTYELEAIVHWIQQHNESPVTRKSLSVSQLYDNLALELILTEETNKLGDAAHPSIRRWKEEVLAHNTPLSGTRTERLAALAEETTTTTPTTATATSAQRITSYPTTYEELDRRRERFLEYRKTTCTLMGYLTLVAVVVFLVVFPFVLGLTFLFDLVLVSLFGMILLVLCGLWKIYEKTRTLCRMCREDLRNR